VVHVNHPTYPDVETTATLVTITVEALKQLYTPNHDTGWQWAQHCECADGGIPLPL